MNLPSEPGHDGPLLAVRRYCESKVPAEHRDELRIECTARGQSIAIYKYLRETLSLARARGSKDRSD